MVRGTVLVMPDYGDANPYQHQLRDALAGSGVTVVSAAGAGVFPVLGAYLAHDRPRILHLHWLHPYLIGAGPITTALKGVRLTLELLVLRLLGARVVWTIHNIHEHDRRAPRVEAACKHLVLRLIDAGIVHCESARTAVTEAFRLPPRLHSKLSVIPHGHYIDWYPDELSRDEARASLDLPASATVFLFFGRIHPYKNVTGLVRAFGELDDPRVRLLIVGQPSDSTVAEAVLAASRRDDRIRTEFGYVPDEAVQRYLKAADVVVLPYHDGLTSGAAVLAASFERSIIAPDRGCTGEQFGTDSGLIYDPASEPLSRVLRRALQVDTTDIGTRNRARVETPTWSTIARRTAAVYFDHPCARGSAE